MKLKFNRYRFIAVFFSFTLLFLFLFREAIFDNQIVRAKIEIIETISMDTPEEAKENIKTIIDSLTKAQNKKLIKAFLHQLQYL